MQSISKHAGPFLAFDYAWFERHQRVLLWLLRWRWFRWSLRIEADHKIVRLLPHAYVETLGGDEFCATFRTHWKYSKRIYYAFRPLWWAMHFWDWLVADRFIPRLSFGFGSLTVYPGTTTNWPNDGQVLNENLSGVSWGTLQGAATGYSTSVSNTSDFVARIMSSATTNLWVSLNRGFFAFDTSAIPSDASLSSATFTLYSVPSTLDELGQSMAVGLYQSTVTASLTTADFDACGSTKWSATTYTAAAWQPANPFVLNATGLSNVAKGPDAITKFCTREAVFDATGLEPTWGNDQEFFISAYMAEETGSTGDPKLAVVYTMPSKLIVPNIRPRAFAPGHAR